ncbi:E3 SUMO-protein ligase ZNF451 [Cheilinus undulatus]|uniref:E3 SUMO-protein ligase ZNF451 n=1 Tax=Cheilinus undulatus TaxID=241271 RepID=UPI001BD6B5E7|nr:E3 SUMO-protein ligase ZNF451 [Cheilinus undulatus]XP_041645871.1 E3 SUMO-protein ligase ZNF451 [Cheilinus undulatus]XP_041645872.1 E3 SUMO-protein ligase ZNF451 [Cheilinus undulatus]XP_041645873.1 E3 SUMO-protein ligase ZNF451 [Cheilinus undulatus]XP_041645874.1 E3 SUMO-protein ligase ZNF451 [Cheilinus undulatus]XP_041645875.1 E3 SUMO-protein ligase ZNF451 [Cheilinus undulatus]XP_041645876.1 E3 SUMO-protein ligase ZNF451 [Cheilinus undulatus]
MSSPAQADEDEVEEVEFISEGPLRPVLECIDLLSDSEDEGCSGTIEDKIACQKRRVSSTLDRLAHQVALEKKERANKCKAFKEKQILQKAHGQQELAFSPANGVNREAKHCVDMWLKMPGVKPGMISTGFNFRRRHREPTFPRESSTKHSCPVINCGRVFDNVSLLGGHLKRFDHSPCDPTITLKGSPPELFACVACGKHFQTKEAWKNHLQSKISSSTPDDHSINQIYQRIVCFACPACYLLFNIRDECLQHMSAKNHFTESLAMNETTRRAVPVPIPQYVKNCLIALCNDTMFNVRCSLCFKVLTSHQAAQAHFNVHCRQGCAVAKADKTIAQVMKQLQVLGQCSTCCKLFFSQAEIERHKELTQHDVEVNQTMEKAVLQHCRFSEIQHRQKTEDTQGKRQSTGLETSFQKRNKKGSHDEEFPAKRQKLSISVNSSTTTLWYCECGQHFPEEAAASKHLLAANQIFHQCGVCGKHMGESSIARLHMSRFHGGAHLSNFLFFCRKCKLTKPRYPDILSHLSEAHSGHTYYTEQEVPEEVAGVIDAKPSTSSKVVSCSSSKSTVQQNTEEMSSLTARQTWMCRMCEDVFDSEADVHKHCSDVNSHSYQKFICGHCPQKFFKESTVRRHCMNEHNGELKSFHFCGLCDSMQFDSNVEFLEHYKSLHSKDYYCMNDAEVEQPTAAESISQLTCPCMGTEQSKGERKAMYTQCMRNLSAKGKCQFVCDHCSVSMPSYPQMKTHIHTQHPDFSLAKTFDVQCKTCQETFPDVPSFHKHHHTKHCTLEPCRTMSTTCRKGVKEEPSTVNILDAVEIKPGTNDVEDEVLEKVLKIDQANKKTEEHEHDSEEEMNYALSVSAEEARESARESADLEEALKRSLLEF